MNAHGFAVIAHGDPKEREGIIDNCPDKYLHKMGTVVKQIAGQTGAGARWRPRIELLAHTKVSASEKRAMLKKKTQGGAGFLDFISDAASTVGDVVGSVADVAEK